MLSGWRRLNGAHRIDQTRFQSRVLLQVEPLGLPAIRLILVDRSEIGFLSHCLPSPFSVTEANGSQVEFVPWRSQKEKALMKPPYLSNVSAVSRKRWRMPPALFATSSRHSGLSLSLAMVSRIMSEHAVAPSSQAASSSGKSTDTSLE